MDKSGSNFVIADSEIFFPTNSFLTPSTPILSNLSMAMDLPIQHLSCYALTVEEDTILFHDIRKGKNRNSNEYNWRKDNKSARNI